MGKIKNKLRNITLLRNVYFRFQLASEFSRDRKRYIKYGMQSSCDSGENIYSMAINCHAVEKGLCYSNPRYFGEDKIKKIIFVLQSENSIPFFYQRWACNTLRNWCSFCKEYGYSDKDVFIFADRYLNSIAFEDADAASVKTFSRESLRLNTESFDEIISSRVSMRRFSCDAIEPNVIEECVVHFIGAPSACNRQLSSLYWVKNSKAKETLIDSLRGLSGFDVALTNFFIVTFDLSALGNSGERNQGFLNAGLSSMNFVNALHSRGVGSTFIEWYDNEKESNNVREICGIPNNETIAVVIGAGLYPESAIIPASPRKSIADVFHFVE